MKKPASYTFKHLYRQLNRYNIVTLWLVIIMLSLSLQALAKADTKNNRPGSIENNPDNPVYDEVSITLNVTRIGSVELSAIIMGQDVYLPVKEMFDFLKIKAYLSPEGDSITGYIVQPGAAFFIDKAKHHLAYQGNVSELKANEIFFTERDFYLRADQFAIFGLDCIFSFRSLSVNLTARIDLPAIREMQQEQVRKNISSLSGHKQADTTLPRKGYLFKMGFADWNVNAYQQGGTCNMTANFNVGMMLAGGEFNANINSSNFNFANQSGSQYRWRLVNNESPVIKQVIAGKFIPQSTATLLRAMTGFQISNTPTTYRRSFGTYTLSNTTKPGWTVELYVNNILVNYTKADASGFYSFDVPVVYGTTVVKLRFFGPWGEEETKEEFINIPFNFLPAHKLEYNLTGGLLNDDEKSRFSRASLAYGLSGHITLGGGVEYLSSVQSGSKMPFVTSSVRLGSGMLLSIDKSFGVRTKTVFSYRHPSNLQVELNYTKFDKEQTAVRFSFYDEKKFLFSMPLKTGSFKGFTRLSVTQNSFSKLKYTTAEWMFTGGIKSVNLNLTNGMFQSSSYSHEFYSSLSFNLRAPFGLRINPQAQYNYTIGQVANMRCNVEKRISKRGSANFNWEKNLRYNIQSFTLGMRFNLSFANLSNSVRTGSAGTMYNQSAQGSILFNDYSERVSFANQAQVGRAAIVVVPFVDENGNGIRDGNEQKAYGLNLRINGGRATKDNKDTTITISGLDAYNSYYIELDKNSFDNVAWQLKKPVIKIVVQPNYFQKIEVPVSVVGEISGTVYNNNQGNVSGMGRIIVNIYNEAGQLVTKVLSEPDGYFTYLGLMPGNYTISLDKDQAKKLNMVSNSAISITIRPGYDGDIVQGLKLVLVNK